MAVHEDDGTVKGAGGSGGGHASMPANGSSQGQQRQVGANGYDDAAEESLQDAAMSIPDSDVESLTSLSVSQEESPATNLPSSSSEISAGFEANPDTSNDTTHQMDWHHFLGLSGQGINAASSATSMGFAAARSTTAFGLNVAKRFTQGLVALPAMAIDGAMLGNPPSRGNYTGERSTSAGHTPTVAEVAHAAVGGLFDVISTLAVGGIDLGNAITGTSLVAAASGVEGVRRALGSEVLRSLGSFSRLVKREWASTSEFLPPGGIPAYSILGITQALTAWVGIQMVTREWYERNMLKYLEPIDVTKLNEEIEALQASNAESSKATQRSDGSAASATKGPDTAKPKKKQVRIIDGEILPGDEGEIIGAEIGQPSTSALSPDPSSPRSAAPLDPERATAAVNVTPLTNAEAVHGLKRYSRLVLGVYGGVALAWLGSLPPDLMQAAGASVDQNEQHVELPAPNAGRPGDPTPSQSLIHGSASIRSAAEVDEADFLRAAASLDLEDGELIGDDAASTFSNDAVFVDAHQHRQASATPPASSTPAAQSGDVLFTAEENESQATGATATGEATQHVTPATAVGRSYSYYDILMGTADVDIFHRLGGLQHGAAIEGDYVPSDPHAESTIERLRRIKNQVARPSKPRYYVVTDHTTRKIVLVFRGSLTLGDIAIDLTCESANFDFPEQDMQSQATPASHDDDEGPQPAEDFSHEAQAEREAKSESEKADAARKREEEPQASPHERSEYIVHEGMYETAKEVGEIGRSVHRAVRRALESYPDYDLDITGHSLGAGVAALLAIMWASPETGRTTLASGLPVGRRTHAYCFGVPCVMGAKLGRLSASLVTSYCYSYDLVCRLSLGAILDIRNACAWLAYENSQTPASAPSTPTPAADHYGLTRPLRLTNIMQRAFVHQAGQLNAQQTRDLEADFLALRKTLQANMRHVELFPPGTVLYSLAQDDVLPSVQASRASGAEVEPANSRNANDKLARTATLYRLRDNDIGTDDEARAAVFGQIVFARGMLSRHMPHLYHAGIDAL